MTDIELNNNIFESIVTHIYSLPNLKRFLNNFIHGIFYLKKCTNFKSIYYEWKNM